MNNIKQTEKVNSSRRKFLETAGKAAASAPAAALLLSADVKAATVYDSQGDLIGDNDAGTKTGG